MNKRRKKEERKLDVAALPRLPSGWCWATVEQLGSLNEQTVLTGPFGSTLGRGDFVPEGVPLLTIGCLTSRGVTLDKAFYLTEEKANALGRYRVREGDLLFSRSASVGRAGCVNAVLNGCVINYHLMRLRLADEVIQPQTFMHYVRGSAVVRAYLREVNHGATRDGINTTDLLGMPVAVPPLNEQKRLTGKVEELLSDLNAVVASLERVQRNLKRYRASVLKAAVEGRLVPAEAELARSEGRDYEPASVLLERILKERRHRWIEDAAEKGRAKAEEKAKTAGKLWSKKDNPQTLEAERAKAAKKYKEPAAPDTEGLPDLPEGWCWVTVESIADQRLGKMLDKSKNVGVLRPYLRNANVRWFGFDLSDLAEMRVTAEEFSEVSVQAGDVVICEGGEPGRCAVWSNETMTIAIQKALHRVRPYLGISSAYFAVALTAEAQRGRLARSFTGSTIKHFTGEALRSFAISLPPCDEQSRIVAQVEDLLSLCESLRTQVGHNLRRCQRLRQSILKWAFEGKLVDQDPDDEPASVLLERIQAERAAMAATDTKKKGRKGGRKRKSK